MTTSESKAAADIERTRAEIGETVQALAAKADVKARAQRKLGEVRNRFAGRADRMGARPGPTAGKAGAGLAALATAAVAAWLWRRRRMRHRSAWQRAAHLARTRAHAKRGGLMRARARTGPAARMAAVRTHSGRGRYGLR
ncbi:MULTISPECIES: DUF3618 domain-containing protein [Thermomonospora]|uniref:Type IV secretory pathway TrbL component n=1 Tax=Thermomonospora cellulosilytica TaxID=1411118 RepID=A0A7W3N041_9ACTN|nr:MULTISPECIES: DUF3618 domain-containing protein [Thermomonospora]MBA9005073.1 type IV secretory pathway TrbL component [Thermomonospora cellulosilytica]